MTKYLINRILRALLSVIFVIAVIMVMIYACLDRTAIFASDPNYPKQLLNKKEVYMMGQWEKFGYVDYVLYTDYLADELKAGNITQEQYDAAAVIAGKEADDTDATKQMAAAFKEKYEAEGYKVIRLPGQIKIGTVKYGKISDLAFKKNLPLSPYCSMFSFGC